MNRVWLVSVLTVSWAVAVPCRANGYRILGVKSAKANAMGEAFAAQADDPSAIGFNPAGIAQLHGNQVNAQVTFCNGYTEHRSPSGVESTNEDRWQAVPAFYFTSDLGEGRPVLGLGVSVPNGLASEWSSDSFARYVATYSELFVTDIAPSIAMQFGEKVMLGGSLNYYYSEARLDRMVDVGASMGAPGAADVTSELEGAGSAWGFNLGAIYDITDRHRIAAAYHHAYSVDYDGDLRFAGVATAIDAGVDFPASVVLAYAIRAAEAWTVEVDLDWTAWGSTDNITIAPKASGAPELAMEQDLDSAFSLKLGTEYQQNEAWAWRCGYIYNQNATSESTWRPSLPDSDTHFFTGGFGYTRGNLTWDTALQILIYEERQIDNNVDANEFVSSSSIDGTYQTWAPCLSLGATYRF